MTFPPLLLPHPYKTQHAAQAEAKAPAAAPDHAKHTQSEIGKVLATAPGAAGLMLAGEPHPDKDHVQRTKHHDDNLTNHGKGHGHVGIVDQLAAEHSHTHQKPRHVAGHNKYKHGPGHNKQHQGFGHAKHYDFE